MKYEVLPTREELVRHSRLIPEIEPSAVLAMLSILNSSAEIRAAVTEVLERDYKLSEGKLCVLIVMHQHPEGVAPSELARHAGVTRATISVMLQRLVRDGLAAMVPDREDGRGKLVRLTPQGRSFMQEILPQHYLRISNLMGRLSEDEQDELIRLLKKVASH